MAQPTDGRFGAWTLAAFLFAAGITHFAVPDFYVPLIPDQLGDPLPWVYGSGLAELACAAGLVPRRTRRGAAWATAAVFVAVFPANVQMAVDSGGESTTYQVLVWARLPVQIPLVIWALVVARRSNA